MLELRYDGQSFPLEDRGNAGWLAQIDNGIYPGVTLVKTRIGAVHVNLSESVPFAVIDSPKTGSGDALPRGVAGTPRLGTDQF